MSRYTIFAVVAALCLTIASADLSSASYSAPPGKVFDGSTGAADVLTWGTYSEAKFGPGTDNTTVYAYGVAIASGTLNKVASRKLNATLLSNGTAASAVTDAKIGDDTVASPTLAIGSHKTAVGLGNFAIAYVHAVSTCPQVTVAIYPGGSSSPTTKAVTTNTCSKCTDGTANSAGVGYVLAVTDLFYENGTYYVAWTSQKYSETGAASGGATGCSSTYPNTESAVAKSQVYSYLQGVTTAGELKWTTAAVTIFTGTETAVDTAASPSAATIAPNCGPQNYTNSTNFYCAYSDGSNNIKAVKIVVDTGVPDSGTTIATSTPYPGSAPAAETTYYVYTFGGFVYGLYQQGILLNKAGAKYAAAATSASAWTNTLQLYNLTSGASSTTGNTAGGIAVGTITNAPSAAGTTFAGAGITYGQGYAIMSEYSTTSGGVTTTTYEFSPFFANSTANGSKVTVAAQGPGAGNYYADANGALWFGGYTTASSLLTTGYTGKLVAQLYSAGNILASFFALISLMIAALFAF